MSISHSPVPPDSIATLPPPLLAEAKQLAFSLFGDGRETSRPFREALTRLGIEGPAIFYLGIDGCVSKGPHNVKNLETLAQGIAALKTQNGAPIKLYLIDVGLLDSPNRTIRDAAGLQLPGIYTRLPGDAEQTWQAVRALGFIFMKENPYGHDGRLFAIDSDGTPLAYQGNSKTDPAAELEKIQQAFSALPPRHAATLPPPVARADSAARR